MSICARCAQEFSSSQMTFTGQGEVCDDCLPHIDDTEVDQDALNVMTRANRSRFSFEEFKKFGGVGQGRGGVGEDPDSLRRLLAQGGILASGAIFMLLEECGDDTIPTTAETGVANYPDGVPYSGYIPGLVGGGLMLVMSVAAFALLTQVKKTRKALDFAETNQYERLFYQFGDRTNMMMLSAVLVLLAILMIWDSLPD